MSERVVVVGLGYVGLPLAVALAEKFDVVGFDIDTARIADLENGIDKTAEIAPSRLKASTLTFSSSETDLANATFIIVTVPTPVDEHNTPDLSPLRSASRTIGRNMTSGAVVVYESTVYPGATEEVCAPILSELSGLALGSGFFLGYSPERINPGDTTHTIDRVVKVIAASDPATLERLTDVYGSICHAGLHKCPTIRVAEAAKVIENTQRDLNIALMNELALIFERLDINTSDVLAAAQTKWNFLPFVPGLVGGHCIGVDPYYLTYKAQSVGFQPEVILAGRRINSRIGAFVAAKTIKLLAAAGRFAPLRIAVLGLTFKEGVPDLRNSRVPDIIDELKEFGVNAIVHDPLADPAHAHEEYGVSLSEWPMAGEFDAVIVAVAHDFYREREAEILAMVPKGGVVIDLKGMFNRESEPANERVVWSL